MKQPLNPFSTAKLKNAIFEVLTILQTLNINNQRTTSAKYINLQFITKLIKYYSNNVPVMTMFSLTVFKILLLEVGSLLGHAQWFPGSERIKFSVKKQKNVWYLLQLLEKWLPYKLSRFWMVFNFFLFCLTLSVPEKLKMYIFEIPAIPQTLNINN